MIIRVIISLRRRRLCVMTEGCGQLEDQCLILWSEYSHTKLFVWGQVIGGCILFCADCTTCHCSRRYLLTVRLSTPIALNSAAVLRPTQDYHARYAFSQSVNQNTFIIYSAMCRWQITGACSVSCYYIFQLLSVIYLCCNIMVFVCNA